MNYFKRAGLDISLYFLERKIARIKRNRKAKGIRWTNESWDKYYELIKECDKIKLSLKSQEYVTLYKAKNKLHQYEKKLYNENKIPHCVPATLKTYDEKFVFERNNYLLFEIMEGNHNEFLQRIIDRSKDK